MKIKLLILALLVPLGILTKFYAGPGSSFVNNHLGGVLYVVFFIFLASLFFPKTNALKLSLIVLAITCLLEFTQLIQTKFINELREYFLVHALIGSSFNLIDIFWYIIGAYLGWWGLNKINYQYI
ncbi:MAG: DUF2809 domain-containing protein [Bacteroidota bacterium]